MKKKISIIIIILLLITCTTLPVQAQTLKELEDQVASYQAELNNKNSELEVVGEKRIYTPLVITIKKGKVVDYHAKVLEDIPADKVYNELNKEQKEQLLGIYTNMFLKVSKPVCTGDSNC